MRFAVIGEGLTDYKVLKNLLVGFFKDKNLPVTRLLPKDKEPVGWSNVLNYLSSQEFIDECNDEINDYIIVQIDTNECAEWVNDIRHIGDDGEQLTAFTEQLIATLIHRIGNEYYEAQKHKILFAVCVHEIECWLLPFNTTTKAHVKKMVGCLGTLEQICVQQGFSLYQKNYQEGKHYDALSKEMKDNKTLMKKAPLNPSLDLFVKTLSTSFPVAE